MEMQIPSAVIDVHHAFVKPDFRQTTEFRFSPQLSARYDRDTRALWSHWTSAPRPCFNPGLLADIRAYYNFIGESDGRIDCGDAEEPIEYVILASGMPGVFNLGGDLLLLMPSLFSSDNAARRDFTLVQTLPAFSGFNAERLTHVAQECGEILQEDSGLETVLGLIREGLPPILRETAYALAVEVAIADRNIAREEIRFLAMLRDKLELSKLATAAIEHAAIARFQNG